MMCLCTLFDTSCLRCDGPSGAIRSFLNALQTDRKAKVCDLAGLQFRKRLCLELTTRLSTGSFGLKLPGLYAGVIL